MDKDVGKIRIVLTGEGTYPYEVGGVSVWAHLLIQNLAEIDFVLMPIMMHPYVKLKYDLPDNIVDVIKVPLWGTEEPTEFVRSIPFSSILYSKLRTSERTIKEKFIPIFDNLIDHIYSVKVDMEELGQTLLDFYWFFQSYDYHTTFRSKLVWDTFKTKVFQIYEKSEEEVPSVYDMVEALRYMFRFFITLLPPVPYADIYHSSAAAFCGLPCVIAKKIHGSRFLLTEHGIYIREQMLQASRTQMPLRTKEFLMDLITMVARLNYYHADIIAPVCNYNKRWEMSWGAAEGQIHTIYNGIDTERFKRLEVARSVRPTVVMVARIDPLKDIETFIHTCALVAKAIPDALFKLYGPKIDPEYYERCEKLVATLGVERNFIFAGMTSNPAEAYNEGDVVMLTSISEAFPFVVIEAMACEKVMVSSDVGGTKEVLEGFGYVVKPKDYEEFAQKVLLLLSDKTMAEEMGVAAREHILNGFRIEDMVFNYRNMYEGLYQQPPTTKISDSYLYPHEDNLSDEEIKEELDEFFRVKDE
ncbi:MAG: GT4 family glycosyltransferase PelF [Sulfuricurvum sp.]|jgi:glycosyltransferase involved in cell wall biosynthesis|uniref:GT4 family glycosyltransferase PelF n=1 Tax=Sulfuricurvum sp. TaxID=2025608 RepID=UPI0025FD4A10|nr:GT4 family glycosyltransferase PelF [Sulfuricurvum sp.]MCK9372249.1 GT4 family glycosyltransferase PelF [Sulfuricurvum sp.]